MGDGNDGQDEAATKASGPPQLRLQCLCLSHRRLAGEIAAHIGRGAYIDQAPIFQERDRLRIGVGHTGIYEP